MGKIYEPSDQRSSLVIQPRAPFREAEVTHFGRYDRTEDYFGGDTNPPEIHDPGEFTALRASG